METTITIGNQRLLQFARHLEEVGSSRQPNFTVSTTVADLGKKKSIYYDLKYQVWLVNELPKAFKEWFFAKDADVLCVSNGEHLGTIEGLVCFFGLSIPELLHLIDCEGGLQIPQYGSCHINPASDAIDYATCIREFVTKRSLSV